MKHWILLWIILAIAGIAFMFTYFGYNRVDITYVTAFNDGLGLGSTFTSATMQKGDVLMFGYIHGASNITISVSVPNNGEEPFQDRTSWMANISLPLIQDSRLRSFEAPYDGTYDINVDNFGVYNYGYSQVLFRVWVEAPRKEPLLLYSGLALLVGGGVLALGTYFRTHYAVKKASTVNL